MAWTDQTSPSARQSTPAGARRFEPDHLVCGARDRSPIFSNLAFFRFRCAQSELKSQGRAQL
jgi:hypothetical protein